ncbi:hypothetical protein V5O48_000003 [Marasmius crinis-equi]|uniref:Peptidase A1 domain-containing protein n=1 Tax=Marasmius crinis-equi TaxID=585013 RepID=A0ABR3G2W5_9AGAR
MRVSVLAALALILPNAFGFTVPPRVGALRIPLRKRLRLLGENGVVNEDLLRRELTRATNKLQRGFKAFEQNTGSAHPSSSKKIDVRALPAGNPLTDLLDESLWAGPIDVGTPPKTFTVDFDTGSSDLFLPGTGCKANCDGHKVYDTSASSTAKDQGRGYSLRFGDGSTVQGELYHDTVSLADLAATDQAVGSSTEYSTGFAAAGFPPDGLLGLGFPQISVFKENPFFQTLVSQGKVTEPVFAFKLSTSDSELTLGGVDSSKFTGELTQVPVTTVGYWQINADGVSVSGKQVAGQFVAIVDTGTTLVYGDPGSVEALYAAVPGARDASLTVGPGFFTVPCDSVPNDINIVLGGKSFPISAKTFNIGQLEVGSSECVGGFVAGTVTSDGTWLVGDVFLQNVYSVFDVGNTRMGFATLA